MTRSPNTPRIRLTQTWFAALVVASALAGRTPLPLLYDRLVGAAALLLVTAAVLGRIWCSAFIAGRKDAQLVTEGPYALCRHPLYLLSLVGAVGLGLATRSLTLTLASTGLLGALLGVAARREELRLASLHGAAFVQYAAVTPGCWPRWRAWKMPASIELPPAIFWKAFLDGGSFVLLYLLVDAARALREVGVFPTLLALP
jgi:protein-S-isoprenylcysteine O-methyltransferase Ste14